MEKRRIIRSEEGTQTVVTYEPKEFASRVADVASDYVATQAKGSEFVVNSDIADRSGISELNRRSMEDLVEQKALEKLRDIEEKAYQEAYDLGLIEGSEKAFQERKEEFSQQVDRFDEILSNMDQLQKLLVARNEAEIMKVVNLIASRVAKKEIEADQNIVITVINEILEYIDKDQEILVKVSAEDQLFIESVRGKLDKEVEKFQKVKIEPVDGIASGGCVVETDFGVIDATVTERVNRVWETIEKRLPKVQKGEVVEGTHSDDDSEGSEG